jgi:hypothetical protein
MKEKRVSSVITNSFIPNVTTFNKIAMMLQQIAITLLEEYSINYARTCFAKLVKSSFHERNTAYAGHLTYENLGKKNVFSWGSQHENVFLSLYVASCCV